MNRCICISSVKTLLIMTDCICVNEGGNMKRIPIILDGDPGHDDAICWTLASAFDEFDILAVTTVAGNQTIEKTTYNARCIMTLTGIDAPIAMGAKHPLISEPIIAPNFHGVSGLDGPKMPEPVMEVSELSDRKSVV